MRWATFDCYGTLIDWNRGIGDALTGLFPAHRRDDLLSRYHRLEPEAERRGARPYREVLASCARALADELGADLPAGAERTLPDSLPSWPAFEEVPGALRALRAEGWRIAILSNTDPDLLAASIERIGVPPDITITVAEAGSYKPARGHWDAFFSSTGADRETYIHVAASLFHDIAPCAELGLPAVWINRRAERSELPRAAELSNLAGLPEALARLT